MIVLVIVIFVLVGVLAYAATTSYCHKVDAEAYRKQSRDYEDKYLSAAITARRRANLLRDINEALYYGEYLKDDEILDFYERVWSNVQDDIKKELKQKQNGSNIRRKD